MLKPTKRIVAVMSGGLDCLGFLSQHTLCDVTAITFSYGQKSNKEIEVAKKILSQLPFIKEHKIVDISFLKDLHDVQLLDEDIKIEGDYNKSIVVPLRNAIFASIATSYAYSIEAEFVLMGAHMDDIQLTEEGDVLFPDCKPEFYESLSTSLHIGHFRNSDKVEIITPSMLNLNKVDLIEFAYKQFKDLIFETWSCYDGGDVQCGVCLSCLERKKAFKETTIKDKTVYVE